MIFVDESGSRWKKIKTTALAGAGVTGLILGVLVVGSLMTPQWGQLSVLKQAEQAISSNGKAAINTFNKPVLASAPAAKKSSPKLPPKTSTSSTSTPAVLGASTYTATPTPKSTAAPSPSPALTPAPGNSYYGKLHNSRP